MSRGLKNNNPGNIRQTDTDWLGESKNDFDPEFEEFTSMLAGYRALIVLLRGPKYMQGGLDTIQEIISVYAPPSENDTQAYIKAVEAGVGVGRFTAIDRNDRAKIKRLVMAISKHENGVHSDESVVDEALSVVFDGKALPSAVAGFGDFVTGGGLIPILIFAFIVFSMIFGGGNKR